MPAFTFTFLTARQRGLLCRALSILSDRLAVCHTLVSYQNDSSYDHAVFNGG